MLNILKSDFYKLKKSKVFLVCTLVCAALGILFVAVLQAGVTDAAEVVGKGAAEELGPCKNFSVKRILP
jgi:hypothetical protein